MKTRTWTTTAEYTVGRILHLDEIYLVHGLGDEPWCELVDADGKPDDRGEWVRITRNVTVAASVQYK